jgi:hypothetical protein
MAMFDNPAGNRGGHGQQSSFGGQMPMQMHQMQHAMPMQQQQQSINPMNLHGLYATAPLARHTTYPPVFPNSSSYPNLPNLGMPQQLQQQPMMQPMGRAGYGAYGSAPYYPQQQHQQQAAYGMQSLGGSLGASAYPNLNMSGSSSGFGSFPAASTVRPVASVPASQALFDFGAPTAPRPQPAGQLNILF